MQTLKIDIDQIMMGDDLSTNYQLFAGDRLVVRRREGLPRELTRRYRRHQRVSLKRTAGADSARLQPATNSSDAASRPRPHRSDSWQVRGPSLATAREANE